MTRKPKRQAKKATSRAKKSSKSPVRQSPAKAGKTDSLDTFIVTSARTLNLPAKKSWMPAIKANLRVTLQLAATVAEFKLLDDAEPAPVFRA